MGMFDYVDYRYRCRCGRMLKRFQSKDAERMMDVLKPWDVVRFYDYCRYCETWYEMFIDCSKEERFAFYFIFNASSYYIG